MSIRRWLILAGLLGVGACGTGPVGVCTVDDQTGGQVCTFDASTPLQDYGSEPTFLPEN